MMGLRRNIRKTNGRNYSNGKTDCRYATKSGAADRAQKCSDKARVLVKNISVCNPPVLNFMKTVVRTSATPRRRIYDWFVAARNPRS